MSATIKEKKPIEIPPGVDPKIFERPQNGMSRRGWFTTGGVILGGLVGAGFVSDLRAERASVFIARNQSYNSNLRRTIQDGLIASGLTPPLLRGKKVLLKPNLVEPHRERPQMTTNPAMVVAAAEVFLNWGATVTVGEAPGHVRDSEMALIESGMGQALDEIGIRFSDLNYEEVGWLPNAGKKSPLEGIYFPVSVLEADLVVSMPKMKTHHWMGMTGGMKNLYGTLPGIKYGWPKNVLHHAGIPETVYDINATLPSLATIVDGIDCMEGDGPILGSLKHMGLVMVGTNLPAVDATMCRIMDLAPERIPYLDLANRRLGPLGDGYIEQMGESWKPLVSPFKLLDRPHILNYRIGKGPLVT